ncbi:phosphate transport system substrate-binding protein [Conyzicola lurida]|uniref:Phosphate-binding protein n=1 Tax=Conyzicola lurida TaxID=1172621 RepID=A0A841AJH6_9MICO|nr:phosphate transport system substrate-binding protein [Conyzicola lurida]
MGALLAGCATNEAGQIESDLVGTINGAGSSAQSAAQDVWISDFQQNNSRVTVNYEPSGSGAGREQFIAGGVAFAGSDAALSDDELASGEFARCVDGTQGINVPVYVSPLVLIFNVEGVETLRLDAAAIAGIFSNTITRWNDPALVALNEGVSLPDAAITAVHRSDDSGTTKNFTDYLYANEPEVWGNEAADGFPFDGEAAQGNAGIVNAVADGVNAIGYVDASRAGDLAVAQLKVGDEFVTYSADAAAAILDESPLVTRSNPNDIVVAVDRTSTASGVYPLVLVSYLIACQQYDDADEAELVRSYAEWVVSPEGQALAAEEAGSAPLSDEFSATVIAAVESIS